MMKYRCGRDKQSFPSYRFQRSEPLLNRGLMKFGPVFIVALEKSMQFRLDLDGKLLRSLLELGTIEYSAEIILNTGINWQLRKLIFFDGRLLNGGRD
jgi:hypothetical protein